MKDIVLLDGAMGTGLWARAKEKVPVWRYNLEQPEIVTALCREYIAAGAQIVQSNTFGANAPSVKRASSYTVEQVVRAGVRLSKEAAAGTGAKVCLSVGPLSALLEPYGDLTEEEAQAIYEEQIGSGMAEKADLIVLETFMDVEMMRIAAQVAKRYPVPVLCSMTFEKVGKTLMGNSVQDVLDTLTPLGVDAVGMNCSLGPDLALPVIREFAEKTDLPLLFKPNAGKPVLSADGKETVPYDAKTFAHEVGEALPYIRYVGGCCGTDPSYIKELHRMLRN